MSYADNTKKLVVVLDKKLAKNHPGTAMNRAGHAIAGLVARAAADGRLGELDYLDYATSDVPAAALLSRFPVIALTARTKTALAGFLGAVMTDPHVLTNFMSDEMDGGSADEQRASSAAVPLDAQDIQVVVAFGGADALDPLTRKFSLYR